MLNIATKRVGAFHEAHLNPMTGVGMLVLPDAANDVFLGPESINGADWNVALRELDAMGWEILAGEDDLPISEGWTADGREVIALYGREPIMSLPDFDSVMAAGHNLRTSVLGGA